MNYQFLDAYGSVLTAGSSVVGGVNYPVVIAQTTNATITSVVSTIPSSMLVGASILGTVPINGVVPLTGQTNLGKQVASVYSGSDVGVAIWGVRNDSLTSIVSTDNYYSPPAIGPSGEMITANAPLTKWIQGTASVFSGTSVLTIPAQGTSIFTYITAVQVRNDSATSVGITFTGGLGGVSSILGYTVAPANSGSNITYPNGLKTGANSNFSASISGVASVYISAQGFISKT